MSVTNKKSDNTILALDCSSGKSGVTILNNYGIVVFCCEINLIYRSIKKKKTPHLEIKDFTNSEDGILIRKDSLIDTIGEQFTFEDKAQILAAYLSILIKKYDVSRLIIEDYAYYKSTGKLIDLVEMTALMKYIVKSKNPPLDWIRIGPGVIKSFFTGSHVCSKDDLQAAIELKHGRYFKSYDVVDSFSLALLAFKLGDNIEKCVVGGILRSNYKKYID